MKQGQIDTSATQTQEKFGVKLIKTGLFETEKRQVLSAESEKQLKESLFKDFEAKRAEDLDVLEEVDSSVNSLESIINNPFSESQKRINATDLMAASLKEEAKAQQKLFETQQGEFIRAKQNALLEAIKAEEDQFDEETREMTFAEWKEDNKKEIFISTIVTPDEIKKYPGTRKGPKPEDDPIAFADWYLENLPTPVKQLFPTFPREWIPLCFSKEEKKKINMEELTTEDEAVERMTHAHLVSNSLHNLELGFTRQVKEGLLDDSPAEFFFTSHVRPDEVVPFTPDFPEVYQHAQEHIEKWTIFRAYKTIIDIPKAFERIAKATRSKDTPEDEHVPLPSIYGYWNTLPKEIQESPLIRISYRGLEFYKPTVSQIEKERMLNYLAYLSLPFHPTFDHFVRTWHKTEKYQLNQYHIRRFLDWSFNEQGWTDPEEAQQKLDQIVTDAEILGIKGGVFGVMPPKPASDAVLEPCEPIPIDYYDNDDGFWDEYIAEKKRRYAQDIQMIRRPYFTH
eukprot:TRINITY_DN2467_c0_g6_i1.p1 TRINITY_DN2467_c0_g6~~TRINITY_DN2467_c0_g6_i1.p1  ORF type:complete len:510 (+),score=158.24 TRINITY_DN2467_c0_g6_i1:158-1687(+)